MKKLTLAIAASVMAYNASAAVMIDFEGIPDGAAPGNYYAAQGVTFDGGVVRYNSAGAYLTGYSRMTFTPGMAGVGLSMLADSHTGDVPSLVCGSFCESVHIPTTHIPSGVGPNPRTFEPGTLFGTLVADSYDGMFRIDFRTRGLDNIMFDSLQRQPDRLLLANAGTTLAASGVVPEPATLALLGVGMLGLLRRQKK